MTVSITLQYQGHITEVRLDRAMVHIQEPTVTYTDTGDVDNDGYTSKMQFTFTPHKDKKITLGSYNQIDVDGNEMFGLTNTTNTTATSNIVSDLTNNGVITSDKAQGNQRIITFHPDFFPRGITLTSITYHFRKHIFTHTFVPPLKYIRKDPETITVDDGKTIVGRIYTTNTKLKLTMSAAPYGSGPTHVQLVSISGTQADGSTPFNRDAGSPSPVFSQGTSSHIGFIVLTNLVHEAGRLREWETLKTLTYRYQWTHLH